MFTQIKLNGKLIKNRIVRSATRDYLFHADGTVTDEFVSIYEELARNDVGLIICGYLRNDDRFAADEPQGSVDGDQYIPGLSRIAQAVHKYSSVVYGQMAYTGTVDFGQMSPEQFDDIVRQYVKGALTLQKAGFDGTQIHMAHGNFLSSLLEYDLDGSSDDMRLSLPLKIVQEIKNNCGKEFTVIGKMNANRVELERLLGYIKKLYAAGMDAVELSGTTWADKKKGEQLYYLDTAKAIKENIGIPVILVGGVTSSNVAQYALDEGIDMVSMSRAFLCEPDFVQKLKQGGAVSKCLRCNQCLSIQKTRYKRCVFARENAFLKKTFSKN